MVAFYLEGRTLTEVAEAFGVTYQCIQRHFKREGITPRATPVRTKETLSIARTTRTSAKDRFMAYIRKEGECWIWTGKLHPVNGRGRLHFRGKSMYANHAGWVLIKRRTPKGLLVNNCERASCVNPDHWFEGTYSDAAILREQRIRSGTRSSA